MWLVIACQNVPKIDPQTKKNVIGEELPSIPKLQNGLPNCIAGLEAVEVKNSKTVDPFFATNIRSSEMDHWHPGKGINLTYIYIYIQKLNHLYIKKKYIIE